MKKCILTLSGILIFSWSFGQGGNGNGGNGNGGQLGTQNNPYTHLYVDSSIRIGGGTIYEYWNPSSNHFWTTDNPLTINGTHSGFGINLPPSQGLNTLINPQKGNVGIGVTKPKAKLDIDLGTEYLQNEGGLRISFPSTTFPPITPPNTSVFEIRRTNPFLSLFTVQRSGNVGIGTDTPDDKLHVHKGRIKITGDNSFGGPMILFGGNPTVAPNGQWGIEYSSPTTEISGLNFWKPNLSTDNSGQLTVGNYYLFLSDDGNVSVGTNDSKGYKFAVAGNMVAEEIVVKLQNDWPDYVFADSTDLMKLSDVEQYIQQNSHLPNVPSAQEIEQSGINLGEMDAILLRKIEELTLYVIQLKKENDALRMEIEEIKE